MLRPEFPNPQFRREGWVNLNGPWSFTLDMADNGAEKKYFEKPAFDATIEVPFCPESALSGIGHTDFINACWYAREIEIPESALTGRVLLHFGAVDYEATVYVNGKLAGETHACPACLRASIRWGDVEGKPLLRRTPDKG